MAALNLPDGWLTVEEAEQLALLARDRNVLELGAWKGRSTVLLAGSAKHVVSVDRHTGIPGHGGDSLDEYLGNVRGLPNVSVVVSDFQTFVPLLGRFHLAYIDGDHDEYSVYRDSRLARPHADVLAFHDWDFPEVRAGAAWLGEPDGLVGSLAWFGVGG